MVIAFRQIEIPKRDSDGGVSLKLPSVEGVKEEAPAPKSKGTLRRSGLAGTAVAVVVDLALEIVEGIVIEKLDKEGILNKDEFEELSGDLEGAETGEIVSPSVVDSVADSVGKVIDRSSSVSGGVVEGMRLPEERAKGGEAVVNRDNIAEINIGDFEIVREEDGTERVRVKPEKAPGQGVIVRPEALEEIKRRILQRERDREEEIAKRQAEVDAVSDYILQKGQAVKSEEEERKKTDEEEEESEGGCDCPSDLDRAGNLCGNRCAFVKPGGREPDCSGDPVFIADQSLGKEGAEAVRKVTKALKKRSALEE